MEACFYASSRANEDQHEAGGQATEKFLCQTNVLPRVDGRSCHFCCLSPDNPSLLTLRFGLQLDYAARQKSQEKARASYDKVVSLLNEVISKA